jgi:hypothetical protein
MGTTSPGDNMYLWDPSFCAHPSGRVWTGSDRVARFASHLPDVAGRNRSSNLRLTGAHAARGHRYPDERLWRFGGGEPAESQQQGRKLIAQQEDRVRERNADNRSSSGLLDLFGPARNLDLVHSAKENWRREWDSFITQSAISHHLKHIATNLHYRNSLAHVAALNGCCRRCS